jgi:hypothetical protein
MQYSTLEIIKSSKSEKNMNNHLVIPEYYSIDDLSMSIEFSLSENSLISSNIDVNEKSFIFKF